MHNKFAEILRKLAQSNTALIPGLTDTLSAYAENKKPLFTPEYELTNNNMALQRRNVNNPGMAMGYRQQLSQMFGIPIAQKQQVPTAQPVTAAKPAAAPARPVAKPAPAAQNTWGTATSGFQSIADRGGFSNLTQAIAARNKMQRGSADYNKAQSLINQAYGKRADLTLDIDEGDLLLGGKFKNKPVVVEEFGTNELNQPTVNGRTLLTHRINKDLPEDKQRKESSLYSKESKMKKRAQTSPQENSVQEVLNILGTTPGLATTGDPVLDALAQPIPDIVGPDTKNWLQRALHSSPFLDSDTKKEWAARVPRALTSTTARKEDIDKGKQRIADTIEQIQNTTKEMFGTKYRTNEIYNELLKQSFGDNVGKAPQSEKEKLYRKAIMLNRGSEAKNIPLSRLSFQEKADTQQAKEVPQMPLSTEVSVDKPKPHNKGFGQMMHGLNPQLMTDLLLGSKGADTNASAPSKQQTVADDSWSRAVRNFKGMQNKGGFGALSSAIAARNQAGKGTAQYNQVQNLINKAYGVDRMRPVEKPVAAVRDVPAAAVRDVPAAATPRSETNRKPVDLTPGFRDDKTAAFDADALIAAKIKGQKGKYIANMNKTAVFDADALIAAKIKGQKGKYIADMNKTSVFDADALIAAKIKGQKGKYIANMNKAASYGENSETKKDACIKRGMEKDMNLLKKGDIGATLYPSREMGRITTGDQSKKTSALDESMQEQIRNLILENPGMEDELLHNLAEELGIEPDEAEEFVYSELQKHLAEDTPQGEANAGEDYSKSAWLKIAEAQETVEVSPKQVIEGTKVESKEHHGPAEVSTKIALDHLMETQDYYDKLPDVEKEGVETRPDQKSGMGQLFGDMKYIPPTPEKGEERKKEFEKKEAAQVMDTNPADQKSTAYYKNAPMSSDASNVGRLINGMSLA